MKTFLGFVMTLLLVNTPPVADTCVAADKNHDKEFFAATMVLYNLETFQENDIIGGVDMPEGSMARPDMPAAFLCVADSKGNQDACHLEWGSNVLRANYMMESIRAKVIWLRVSSKWRDVWLDHARKHWDVMRGIFCENHSRLMYFDLDGVHRVCP